MKCCRTGEAVIAFNLGHWLKNISDPSFILFFLKLLPWSFHIPFLLCHPPFCSSYSSWYYTKQEPWFPKASSLTKSVGRCRRAFFPSPATSAREDGHIPWPHISACWHLPLYLCCFWLLLLDSWIDIFFSLLNSSGKLWVYQWVNLCSVSKNWKSRDCEKKDRCFHTSIYLSACLLIVIGILMYRRYCFLDKHLLEHSNFI